MGGNQKSTGEMAFLGLYRLLHVSFLLDSRCCIGKYTDTNYLYRFFICSENIGSYMNLWLKSLNRYIHRLQTLLPAQSLISDMIC